MSETRVTRFELEAENDGVTATITVLRVPSPYRASASPDALDVPEDIRDAVRVWLGAR